MQEFAINSSLRARLKRPLGILIASKRITKEVVLLYLSSSSYIVSVGDRTTDTLLAMGIVPSVQIVDGKEMRSSRPLPKKAHKTELRARNPAGTISEESVSMLQSIYHHQKPVRVIVDGEEDLLTLVAVATVPEGASIFYGQPRRGIVLVKVTQKRKERALQILRGLGLTL